VDQEGIIRYVEETFAGVEVLRPVDGLGAGDTFFFYDPRRDRDPARRLPFATIVTKDYAGFDEASQLYRPSVFRLNIGVTRDTFRSLFGTPAGGGTTGTGHDFAALDRLMPHPAYGEQWWVCVLNPGRETFDAVKPLLADAYAKAVRIAGGRDNAES
jgi:hypothetical protein